MSADTLRWVIPLCVGVGVTLMLAIIGAVWRLGSKVGGLEASIAAVGKLLDDVGGRLLEVERQLAGHNTAIALLEAQAPPEHSRARMVEAPPDA